MEAVKELEVVLEMIKRTKKSLVGRLDEKPQTNFGEGYEMATKHAIGMIDIDIRFLELHILTLEKLG